LHRQRLGASAEGDSGTVTTTQIGVASASAGRLLFSAQFQRRERRVLTKLLSRDLVSGDAIVWIVGIDGERGSAAQPGAWRSGVHPSPFRGSVTKIADNRH